MKNLLCRMFEKSIIVLLVFQLIGCGTIFYPERKGQKAGRLDGGVVIMDAIGLFFFLIPGVIAFAVDFGNGTIYLPGSTRVQLKQIKFDPKRMSLAKIEKIIKNETGRSVHLTQGNMQVSRLHSKEEMMACFAQASSGTQAGRLAYAPVK